MDLKSFAVCAVVCTAALKGYFEGRDKYMADLVEKVETDEERESYHSLRSKTWDNPGPKHYRGVRQ